MCMRRPEGRQELMAAKAATPDEAGELEGRYRLRRQRSWTSGQPQPPMKALWTRCPWEAIEGAGCLVAHIKLIMVNFTGKCSGNGSIVGRHLFFYKILSGFLAGAEAYDQRNR